MTDMFDERDLALLGELREVLGEADPTPAGVLTAAQASFTWRTVDTELAELVDDSALAPTVGIRSSGGPRLLTFEAPTLTVVVEVSAVGEARKLVGQLVEPGAARVEVRHQGGSTEVVADDLGRFTLDQVPAGPVSFRCELAGLAPVVTSWVTV